MARKRKNGADLKDFKYVDFWSRKSQWERIPIEKIAERAAKHQNFNVFVTAQRFCSPVQLKDEAGVIDEMVIAPIYFDLDSSLSLVREYKKNQEGKVVQEIDGLVEKEKVRSEELQGLLPEELLHYVREFEKGIHYIPEDVCEKINQCVASNEALSNFVWKKNLEISREDAKNLVYFFKSKFGLAEDQIRVWFSGSKGFHIIIPEAVAGIKPMHIQDMKGVLQLIVHQLEKQLKLESLDKQAVTSSRRMLRLANSAHHKSGKWKIELTHEELLVDDVTKILEWASEPRQDKFYPTLEDLEMQPNAELAQWVDEFVQTQKELKKLETEVPTLTDEVLSQMKDTPVCVKFILERGILKANDRNPATVVLASYFKDTGVPMHEAFEIIMDWTKRIPKGLTSSTPTEIRHSTWGAVKTVYNSNKYHFGCAFIRALHGERRNGSYEVVPCAGRSCPAHTDHRPDNEEPLFMHLAPTDDAKLTGKKVATDVLVSGKLDTSYIVPKKVQYVCSHQPNCNKPCIMHDYNGVFEVEFDERDRILIETTAQSDNQTRGSLRQYIKPGCNKVYPDIKEHINVTELLVVPMAERINSVKQEDRKEEYATDEDGMEYVTRRIYSTDTSIKANHHYRIEGYVYPHPKNSGATILVSKGEPKEDSIGRFKLTPEVIEQFKVFQVPEHRSVDDQIGFIVQDLVGNVTQVYDRDEAHVALLLTYHSCLHYYFQGKLEKRGWMEMIMVGDSGQAKSQMVSRIQDFVGLGASLNAEATTRTGLTYRIEQMGDRWFLTWGRYPLSDRKLLAIDEFSELKKEEFGQLTAARTEGVLKVERVVTAETNARVRLVLLTNPAGSKTLSEFTYPVESLKYLFSTPADIRRLDLALFLKAGDVPDEVLNREIEEPEQQYITSEALRNSILWVWSRKPEQIVIEKEAVRTILKRATDLGKKYGHAPSIPLCDMGDLRKKIARIAIATAALVHSTDETHEMIIVKPEHVEFVYEYIDTLYSMPNCGFDEYNRASRAASELSREEAEEITRKLVKMDEEDGQEISMDILELFRANDAVKANDFTDWLAVERPLVQKRLRVLIDHSMVKKSRGDGFMKLPKLIEYLKRTTKGQPEAVTVTVGE